MKAILSQLKAILADFEPVEGDFGQLKPILSQLKAILTDFEPIEGL